MPPKPKEAAPKKPPPPIVRQPISESSLFFVPEDAVEGYQERIVKGIEWTLVEKAARYHKYLCNKPEIPNLTFSEALQNKIDQSILGGFFNQESNITLEQQWELLLPITLWDQEKFANGEGKICFQNRNCITDDLIKFIKKAVKLNDSKVLKQQLQRLTTLRVNDSQMTELDEDLLKYKNVVNLNLCGNFLSNVDTTLIPAGVKSLELQVNRISDLVSLVENLPSDLSYLGLARNLITNDFIEPLSRLPYQITVLDLSDNDIYHLEPLLEILAKLPHLRALLLAGNPCAVCYGYARTTFTFLPLLKWLDCRQVLSTDRPQEPLEPHPDNLRAAYFTFTVFRIMSATQPPKPEKGAVTTFHVELELPLLDSTRRQFLMFRNHESLVEMLPPPEDGSWEDLKLPSTAVIDSKTGFGSEQSPHESDIYKTLTVKNSREILHYTTFESTRVQWNKIMNFQEPAVKIFCPDLMALRDTFRSVITVRVIYSVTVSAKQGKPDKKTSHQSSMKTAGEQRVTLATIKCSLRQPDWSQPAQHFHWDDSLGTSDAIHWGDGDLSVLQYSQTPVKITKTKQDTDVGLSSRQQPPDNLTCHFGFGIETLKA